jgi:hypothetical protein
MPIENVTLLAVHVLAQTKANVPDCGKQSEFLVLKNDGDLSPVSVIDLSYGEMYSQQFTNIVASVMFDLANAEKDPHKVIEKFTELALALRQSAASRDYYIEFLRRLTSSRRGPNAS